MTLASTTGEACRFRANAGALEYLKTRHSLWLLDQDAFGDAHNTAIARLVMVGWMERRPYDLSAIAAATNISRQQAARRCSALAVAGWVTARRDANHILVLPTDKLIDRTCEVCVSRIPKLLAKVQGIAALISSSAAGVVASVC